MDYTTRSVSGNLMKIDAILEITVQDVWSHHVQGLGHVPIKFKDEV